MTGELDVVAQSVETMDLEDSESDEYGCHYCGVWVGNELFCEQCRPIYDREEWEDLNLK